MRFDLDLYVNQRPFLRRPDGDAIDFIVIRENTEGTYAGEGGFLRKGTPHEIATQGSVNTRLGVERCVRYAFELARSRAAQAPHAGAQDQRAHLRRRPVGAHLRRGRRRVPRRRRPPTTTSTPPASTSSQDPQRYDVIVTDNLFGDILTDLGGAVSGGIGFAVVRQPQPGPHRPVACSSRSTARPPTSPASGKANPVAAILSAAMMLDFLGEADAAARIRKACADTADAHRLHLRDRRRRRRPV